jgi:phosphotriesterase-related protein
MNLVNTVTGTCSPDQLGLTLMHEHLMIGWAGWETDSTVRYDREAALRLVTDKVKELRDLGLETFVDPCPMDLGRDVEFMAEVSHRTGVRVICATGLYTHTLGANAYYRQRKLEELVEIYVHDLTVGIGETGIKAGLIKCATGDGKITKYEERCLRAAAQAHLKTGAPITTHTENGTMGPQQLDIFASEGVDLSRVIIGHSCGNSDLRYHLGMLKRGCTLGFDRFGIEVLLPDKVRLAAMIGLIGIGYEKQLVPSCDSAACLKGRQPRGPSPLKHPSHLWHKIFPALRAAGVGEDKLRAILIDNPRRFFSK